MQAVDLSYDDGFASDHEGDYGDDMWQPETGEMYDVLLQRSR